MVCARQKGRQKDRQTDIEKERRRKYFQCHEPKMCVCESEGWGDNVGTLPSLWGQNAILG